MFYIYINVLHLYKCSTYILHIYIYIYTYRLGKLSSDHKTGKDQLSFQFQRRAVPKNCSNYCTTEFISHDSTIMLKILQARLQQYVNQELPDVQPAFRKGRGARDQIANIHRIIEKAREFQKSLLLLH